MYQPPARNYIPIPDLTNIFRRNCPAYMIADLNANHPSLGYNHSNITGRQINNTLIQNRLIQHIGPEFPTFYTRNRTTTPDIIILTNYRTHHNTHAIPGPLTTSDHIPIIFTISTSPILIPAPPRAADYKKKKKKKTHWEKFQAQVNNTLHRNNLDQEMLETNNWRSDW